VAHAVSLFFTKSERMSPPAAVLALLLHALVAFLLWWATTLQPKDAPAEEAIEVTMEQPPPPPEPKPEPKPAPEPPKPPPAAAAKPAPPPPPISAFTPFQPAAPLDKKNEGAGKPSNQAPEGKPTEKVEDVAPEKTEAPQQALAPPPAPTPPDPTPPAPKPPTLEKELPPVDSPPAPVTSIDIPKPAPAAPEPKPQPQPKPPQPAPQPPAPQTSLAPSPLSRLPPRGAPPPSARRDPGPPPSPFVNPADVRVRNDITNTYLQRIVYKVESQRGTDGNPAWLRLRMGVHVVIARDGRLLQVAMAQSSGNPEADRVMIQTFRDAAPFAPVPPELPGETFSFTLPFSFVAR
jgi:TonB family protein